MTREEVEAAVGLAPFWWHSIDLGGGLVTPGTQSRPHHYVWSLESTAKYLVAETGMDMPAKRLNTRRYRAIVHAWK